MVAGRFYAFQPSSLALAVPTDGQVVTLRLASDGAIIEQKSSSIQFIGGSPAVQHDLPLAVVAGNLDFTGVYAFQDLIVVNYDEAGPGAIMPLRGDGKGGFQSIADVGVVPATPPQADVPESTPVVVVAVPMGGEASIEVESIDTLVLAGGGGAPQGGPAPLTLQEGVLGLEELELLPPSPAEIVVYPAAVVEQMVPMEYKRLEEPTPLPDEPEATDSDARASSDQTDDVRGADGRGPFGWLAGLAGAGAASMLLWIFRPAVTRWKARHRGTDQ
jgi:hypothetical protein